jgi:hypothetical protein
MVVAENDGQWKSAASALKASGYRVVRARSQDAARLVAKGLRVHVTLDVEKFMSDDPKALVAPYKVSRALRVKLAEVLRGPPRPLTARPSAPSSRVGVALDAEKD